jgi:hypothetical protein
MIEHEAIELRDNDVSQEFEMINAENTAFREWCRGRGL